MKCPYTKFNVTPLDACSDPDFFMEKVDDKQCRLKRDQDILIMLKFKDKWVSQEQNGVISLYTRAEECIWRELHLIRTIGKPKESIVAVLF